MAATVRAPSPALPAADSSRSRARSSSIPSAAATRCRRAEAAPSDSAAAWCSSRRRVGARSAYSAARYNGWVKYAGVLASPGHHATKPVPSNASSAWTGWPTRAIRPATGKGTASPTTDNAAASSRASGGSSASRARIIDASDRGTGSSPPGAASCAAESSASKVRTYKARPPLCSCSRPTARQGKARPASRAISPTSSLLRAPSTTRKLADGSSSRRSHPSDAAPGRLVTNSSTRSSPTRRTTVNSAWRDSRSAQCRSSTTTATGPRTPASVSNATRSSPTACGLPPPSMPSCSSTANG